MASGNKKDPKEKAPANNTPASDVINPNPPTVETGFERERRLGEEAAIAQAKSEEEAAIAKSKAQAKAEADGLKKAEAEKARKAAEVEAKAEAERELAAMGKPFCDECGREVDSVELVKDGTRVYVNCHGARQGTGIEKGADLSKIHVFTQ